MTFYHVYRRVGHHPDIWEEVINPETKSGRWHGKTNEDAVNQVRGPKSALLEDHVPVFMAIAQHRVRTFPDSMQDDRPFDDEID